VLEALRQHVLLKLTLIESGAAERSLLVRASVAMYCNCKQSTAESLISNKLKKRIKFCTAKAPLHELVQLIFDIACILERAERDSITRCSMWPSSTLSIFTPHVYLD
jgi:hypothetical protein